MESSGWAVSTWRMKFEPMNPAPPVTRSFTPLSARRFPDGRPHVVPGQSPLVARRRLGREVEIREVDDAARPGAEVPRAVGQAGRNAQAAGGAVAQHQTHGGPTRGSGFADIDGS